MLKYSILAKVRYKKKLSNKKNCVHMIIEKDDEVTILKSSFYTGDFRKLYITKMHVQIYNK